MKRIVLALALLLSMANGAWGQMSQWDVYNAIPNYKEISLYFSKDDATSSWRTTGYDWTTNNLSMYINDDYTVTFYYSNPIEDHDHNITVPFSIVGKGILLWENEHMVLKMEIKAESPGAKIYIGGPWDAYDHYGEIHKVWNYVCDVEYKEIENKGCFVIGGNCIIEIAWKLWNSRTSKSGNLVIDAERFRYEKLKISGHRFIKNMVQKSQSELNAQNSDVYGKWQWNDNRSKIYLSSTSNDSHLILWNNNDTLSWGFSLPDKATGYKTDTADSGENLEYLMITFDGSSEQSFSFINDGNNFTYAQYDRFMGTLKRDASILNQIKDKRILIVNYKLDGSDKTAMFQLEGLEAIYNAITQ